jgi:hypothetical protein
MSTPIKDPRFRYDLVIPELVSRRDPRRRIPARRIDRSGDAAGVVTSRRWLVDTILHGQPIGTAVENLRGVDQYGRDLNPQPEFFTETDEQVEALEELRGLPFHPGAVVEQAAQAVGTEPQVGGDVAGAAFWRPSDRPPLDPEEAKKLMPNLTNPRGLPQHTARPSMVRVEDAPKPLTPEEQAARDEELARNPQLDPPDVLAGLNAAREEAALKSRAVPPDVAHQRHAERVERMVAAGEIESSGTSPDAPAPQNAAEGAPASDNAKRIPFVGDATDRAELPNEETSNKP